MDFISIITPLVLFLIFLIYLKREQQEVSIVKSKIDGDEYLVINKPDKEFAADTLAQVKQKLLKLLKQVSDKFDKAEKNKHENIRLLLQRFNPNAIVESGPDNDYSTYTLNKGEKIVMCLRTRDGSDKLHSLNLLMFVAIHELAHIMTKSKGHTEEFKDNFLFLLEHAITCGAYRPEDYRSNPEVYCGIDVTDTPLGDEHFTYNV